MRGNAADAVLSGVGDAEVGCQEIQDRAVGVSVLQMDPQPQRTSRIIGPYPKEYAGRHGRE